jgi:uncharacterized cupredoxin-like copper-binding protein
MLIRRCVVAIALVVVPLIAACSSGASSGSAAAPAGAASPAAASAQQVSVKALDTLKFDPTTITVKAGQPVRLTLVNDGAIVHDWTLSQGAAQKVQVTVQGKQQGTVTFTVDKPGSYQFICDQPGHEAAGMVGTLVVQ